MGGLCCCCVEEIVPRKSAIEVVPRGRTTRQLMNPKDKEALAYLIGYGPVSWKKYEIPKDIESQSQYVKKVCCGESHIIFMLGNAKVMVCGENQYGQLGLRRSDFPEKVDMPILNELEIEGHNDVCALDIACGTHHTMILAKSDRDDEFLIVFGKEVGLGYGDLIDRDTPSILSIEGTKNMIDDISASFNRSMVTTTEGKIFQWGEEFSGSRIDEPTLLHDFGTKLISFSLGYMHALAVTDTLGVFSWGDGSYGELGHKDNNIYEKPTLIEYFSSSEIQILKVAAGTRFSIALDKYGEIYTFGCNSLKECGRAGDRSLTPEKLSIFMDEKTQAYEIFAGATQGGCITNEGELFTWGDASAGRLGHSESELSSLPKRVESLVGSEITSLAIGPKFSIVCTGPYTVSIRSESTIRII